MAFRFPAPVIVSFGEENFFLDRDLLAFKKQPERSVTELDGEDLTESDLVSVCDQHSFDGRPRVVVVDNANKVKEGKLLKAYVESRDPKDLGSVLAMVFRADKISALWGKNPGKVYVAERKKLKAYDTNNEVTTWIEAEAKKIGLKHEPLIPSAMFQIVGPDLYRCASELRKLLLIVPAGQAANLGHLKLVVSPGATADVWQVVDAASVKDSKKAMNSLNTLYKQSSEDPSVALAYALMKQVERVYIAASLLSKGASDEDIASRIGMHPWRCKTFFIPLAKKHTLPKLSAMMRNLCKLDLDVKRAVHKRTFVELAVLNFAA